jgi:hypothetical protein
MFKLILFFFFFFLIYKLNDKKMGIKKFKDFANESFLNNNIFNLFGSIIQGEKDYKPFSNSEVKSSNPPISSSAPESLEKVVKLSQGTLNVNSNKTAPLIVVFGGINVGGRTSGQYMYDYFTSDVLSKFNVFIAKSSSIDGKKAWEEIKDKCKELSISPSSKILYLFSGGYSPAMKMDSSSDVNKRIDYLNSNFNKIYLVDIWIGNDGSYFYQKLAEKYGNKIEYYSYGGSNSSGGSGNSAVRKIIVSKSSKSHLTSPDHMKTNLEAVKSLKNSFK